MVPILIGRLPKLSVAPAACPAHFHFDDFAVRPEALFSPLSCYLLLQAYRNTKSMTNVKDPLSRKM